MLRERVDRDQRLERLRKRPILGELIRMKAGPFADEPSARGGSDPFRTSSDPSST